MDEFTIKEKGVKPLMVILHQVADMFPVKDTAFPTQTLYSEAESDDLGETMIYLYNLGLSPFLSLGAGADDKNPDKVVAQASPPWRIGLPAKDYYQDSSVVAKYTETIAQIFEKVHPNHKQENTTLHSHWTEIKHHDNAATQELSKNYAQNLVELEKKLAAASPDAEDMGDVTVSLSPCQSGLEI